MATLNPRCVGSTDRIPSHIPKSDGLTEGITRLGISRHPAETQTLEHNFSQAQFSNDGTTVVTQNGSKILRTFVLPSDLLDGSERPHTLQSQITLTSPTQIQAYSIFRHYNLSDPSTNLVLSSSNDFPITLSNTSRTNSTHANYPLINPTTEAYIAPSSLLWTHDGTHFIAGSQNNLAIFDASYPGEGPVLTHKTALGRREARKKGVSPNLECKGTITALSTNHDGILAAGTRNRNLALYSNEGSGECITSFSLSDPLDVDFGTAYKGTGILQLAWDASGTYLLVAERQSDGISVFDMRTTYRRVAWLSGRKASCLQKLSMDVVPTADGHEVWAGGIDGCVRMWKNSGDIEGEHRPDGLVAAHEGAVAGTAWHPSGAVLATCAGTRDSPRSRFGQKDDSEDSEDDDGGVRLSENSLKIWTV